MHSVLHMENLTYQWKQASGNSNLAFGRKCLILEISVGCSFLKGLQVKLELIELMKMQRGE